MIGKKGAKITWEVCGEEFYWVEPEPPHYYFGGVVRKDNCECEKDHEGNHSLVWPNDTEDSG